MKDLEKIQRPDKVEIVNERQVEYQKILFDSITKHKGHTMYEVDCTTGEIREAEYNNERVVLVENRCLLTGAVIGTSPKTVRDINSKPNCLYIPALNKKSARKKYAKWLFEKMMEKISESQNK